MAEVFFELIQARHFSITAVARTRLSISARRLVLELGAKDVSSGTIPSSGRLDHLDRRRRKHVSKRGIPRSAGRLSRNLLDVSLRPMLFPTSNRWSRRTREWELGIMQSKVRKFGALLNQVQLRHAFALRSNS